MYSKKKSGFTLIEVLIVLLFISLFAGMGLARFNDYSDTQKMENNVSKLIDVFELAKKNSATAFFPTNPSSCEGIFQGYSVYITNSGYSMRILCDTTTTFQNYLFDTPILLGADHYEVIFPALNGQAVVYPVDKMILSGQRLEYCIKVDPSGLIRDAKMTASVCPLS